MIINIYGWWGARAGTRTHTCSFCLVLCWTFHTFLGLSQLPTTTLIISPWLECFSNLDVLDNRVHKKSWEYCNGFYLFNKPSHSNAVSEATTPSLNQRRCWATSRVRVRVRPVNIKQVWSMLAASHTSLLLPWHNYIWSIFQSNKCEQIIWSKCERVCVFLSRNPFYMWKFSWIYV